MREPKTIDCRGLACPQPVLETRDALAGATGAFLVVVDTEGSATNVRRFAESQGARVDVAHQGGEYHLTIEPGHAEPAAEPPPLGCPTPGGADTVVFVASEGMGRGDDELGGVLMAAFLDTLAQFPDRVSHAVLVNGGARLAVVGSPVLDQLRHLEEMGSEVLVCGTCLRHFGISDELAVGRVSNMVEILETLTAAGRIIRP
jgi:tRNA 2-thiouridine synthesizing protein A